MGEAEHRIDAAVVQEPKTAHLIALETIVTTEKAGVWGIPEHPDLLIKVAQVGCLEKLRVEVETRQGVGAKKSGFRGAGVGIRVDRVTAGAGQDDAAQLRRRGDAAVDGVEELASGLLVGCEHVVERLVRVGRIGHLEDEVGEGVHVLLRQDLVAPEQVGEGPSAAT